MRLYPLNTEIVKPQDDLVEITLKALERKKLKLENNDVLAFASKIISYATSRISNLDDVKPSEKAKEIAERFQISPKIAELIIQEAEKIYGGVAKAVLTLKNGVLTPNAGIDSKNAPPNSVVLWPSNAKEYAQKIRKEIGRKTGKKIGVLIVDSGLTPLRIGTTGLALAVAGFKPIRDHRGNKDLYGKTIIVTRHAVADDLASAAHLLMGEATEKTPIVLIKDAPVDFDDGIYDSRDTMMLSEECIFMATFLANLNCQLA